MSGEGHKWLESHGRSFGHFINNKWFKPEGRKTLDSTSPTNLGFLAKTIQGTNEDIDLAVAAANEAAKTWAHLPGYVRGRHLYNIARTIEKHLQRFAEIEALDNGKCIGESVWFDIPAVVKHLDYHAGAAQLMDDTFHGKWKPVGVVGAIVPWNFPLVLMSWKVCPAMAMGNTVVLKSASNTRLSALLFAEICAEAGLPPGVFNVVTGPGPIGSHLANHPQVDKAALTGSTEVGQILRRLTAGSGKKLSLELGGKSPVVVHADTNLDMITEGLMYAIYFNQGEICAAGSRLVVDEKIHDQLIEKIKARLSKFRVGDSLDQTVNNGAIIDETQWKSIERYVRTARKAGYTVWQRWESLPEAARATPEELAKGEVEPKKGQGFFYPPTLIMNCPRDAKVVQEEIFGPVLVVLKFKTAAEALEIANDSVYGLVGSVWTKNIYVGLETALNIKSGLVWINTHNQLDPAVGFGGYKTSGYGRDGGEEGLLEYIKPSWMKDFRGGGPLAGKEFDLSKFGVPKKADGSDVDKALKLFINSMQEKPETAGTVVLKDAKGGDAGHVALAGEKDIEKAVAAAKAASAPALNKRGMVNRALPLYAFAHALEAKKADIAAKLAAMAGEPLDKATYETERTIERLFYWAGSADKHGGAVQEAHNYSVSLRVHEPVGIVGVATPDEMPLLSFVSLLGPLIARGNAIIVAPSEKLPPAVLEILYGVLEKAALPAGTVNVVTGDRDYAARRFAGHNDLTSAWYFGSAEGSKFVEHASADTLKRTFVNYGRKREWDNNDQGQGLELLYHATQIKNICMPIQETFLK